MNLCDPSAVKALLARHGFRFQKSLGQNFLIDPSVPLRIAEGCGVTKEDSAFEVGPGIGTLTLPLSQRAGRVLALELDRALLPILSETLAEADNVTVLSGDVLKSDLSHLKEAHLGPGRAVACANLPYYITTPAVTALIEAGCFSDVTVMVQREVALRMAAEAGSGDYGAFSVYIQTHARPELLFPVPADCFLPRPTLSHRRPGTVLRRRPGRLCAAKKNAAKRTFRCLFRPDRQGGDCPRYRNLRLSCRHSGRAAFP